MKREHVEDGIGKGVLASGGHCGVTRGGGDLQIVDS